MSLTGPSTTDSNGNILRTAPSGATMRMPADEADPSFDVLFEDGSSLRFTEGLDSDLLVISLPDGSTINWATDVDDPAQIQHEVEKRMAALIPDPPLSQN